MDIAGFGIQMEDIKWLAMVAFICIGVVQYALTPDMNVFELLDKKVIGYPTCEAVFCFAPSNGDIQNAAASFSGISSPQNSLVFQFVSAVLFLVNSVWVLFKGLVIILIFAPIVMFLYNTWYPMWGVGFGR